MASRALLSFLFALLFAVTRCRHLDPQVGFNFNQKSVPDPFAASAKTDDVKRPFGGGGMFSSSRLSDDRWGDQRSLSPWAMSKFVLKQPDTKRYHIRPLKDEEMNYLLTKRPFGPRIYTRPPTGRDEKRPFGGNMIFSRPREEKRPFGGNMIFSRPREEKRPFGGNMIFSRPREVGSKPREEKRPFGGNMIFSRPREVGSKPREEKRPFGGNMIFSRPREVGAKPREEKRPFGGNMIFSRPREVGSKPREEKRPFGGNMIFSRPREVGSKPREEKRPFGGNMIFSRPREVGSKPREEKRPFGGNMIFSKPREVGTKSRFGGYHMSRARREDSWGSAESKLRDRTEKSPSSVFQNGFDESERDTWLEGLGSNGEGRLQHRELSLPPYDDDYKDDEFDSDVREDEIDDKKDEE